MDSVPLDFNVFVFCGVEGLTHGVEAGSLVVERLEDRVLQHDRMRE